MPFVSLNMRQFTMLTVWESLPPSRLWAGIPFPSHWEPMVYFSLFSFCVSLRRLHRHAHGLLLLLSLPFHFTYCSIVSHIFLQILPLKQRCFRVQLNLLLLWKIAWWPSCTRVTPSSVASHITFIDRMPQQDCMGVFVSPLQQSVKPSHLRLKPSDDVTLVLMICQ